MYVLITHLLPFSAGKLAVRISLPFSSYIILKFYFRLLNLFPQLVGSSLRWVVECATTCWLGVCVGLNMLASILQGQGTEFICLGHIQVIMDQLINVNGNFDYLSSAPIMKNRKQSPKYWTIQKPKWNFMHLLYADTIAHPKCFNFQTLH